MGDLQQAQHIDLENLRMLLRGDGLEVTKTQQSRTVEQHMQRTGLATEVLQCLSYRLFVGDIQRPLPGVVQLPGQSGQRLGIAVQQPHPPAPRMKQPSAGRTDSRRSPGDQNMFHWQPCSLRKAATRCMASLATCSNPQLI